MFGCWVMRSSVSLAVLYHCTLALLSLLQKSAKKQRKSSIIVLSWSRDPIVVIILSVTYPLLLPARLWLISMHACPVHFYTIGLIHDIVYSLHVPSTCRPITCMQCHASHHEYKYSLTIVMPYNEYAYTTMSYMHANNIIVIPGYHKKQYPL
jgi:hypothetical protein